MDRPTTILFFTILLFIKITNGLIGYDCGGYSLNITSLSLLDIGNCDVEDIEPVTQNVYVQLLQLSDFDKTQVIQCKVEVDRTIYYCGMHSHVSIIHNGRRVHLQEVTASNWRRIHEIGTIDLGSRESYITGLKSNSTTTRSIILAGSTSMDRRCTGTQFNDPYGTWDNVVVQASIRITLCNFEAPIRHSSDEIILPSGLHCKIASVFGHRRRRNILVHHT